MSTEVDEMAQESLRIVRSASFERKQSIIRAAVLKWLGKYESVLELGGKIVGSDVIVTDGLIPKAVIGRAHFKVEDRDLSACWSEAEQSHAHLNPVADLHYHPESTGYSTQRFRPEASYVDQVNSLRQASLYFPFNMQIVERDRALQPETVSTSNGHQRYRIDNFRIIDVLPKTNTAPEFDLVFRESRGRALWGSLIYPSDGCSDLVGTYVTVHEWCSNSDGKLRVLRYQDVPTVILADEEVADLTGWPLERIRLSINLDELEKEVILKYRVERYGWLGSPVYHCSPGYSCDSPGPWWENRYRSYPAEPHPLLPWSEPELSYLSERSEPADVAELLREAAAVLDGKQPGQSDLCYLSGQARAAEVVKALQECMRLITSTDKDGDHEQTGKLF